MKYRGKVYTHLLLLTNPDSDWLGVALHTAKGIWIFNRKYAISRLFMRIYLCRKSDPGSKGKSEQVIKYVKNNFTKYRLFKDLDSWQQSFLEWLKRTGNYKVYHNRKKSSFEVHPSKSTLICFKSFSLIFNFPIARKIALKSPLPKIRMKVYFSFYSSKFWIK